MKRKAKFPALGSRTWVRFVEKPPERAERESDEAYARRQALCAALADAEIEVVLRDRATVLEFDNRLHLLAAKEDARRAAATAGGDGTGVGLSLEFLAAMRDLHREIVETYVTGVRGIEVGDVDLETLRDGRLLATLLDTAGLLADASALARRAQTPTAVQLEHCGSS